MRNIPLDRYVQIRPEMLRVGNINSDKNGYFKIYDIENFRNIEKKVRIAFIGARVFKHYLFVLDKIRRI